MSWVCRPECLLYTGFVTRLTRRVPLVEQELLTLPEHLSSPPVVNGVRVTRSLVLCVCFVDRCLSFCTFVFWLLWCLFFFDIRILIISLVSSNSSYSYSITAIFYRNTSHLGWFYHFSQATGERCRVLVSRSSSHHYQHQTWQRRIETALWYDGRTNLLLSDKTALMNIQSEYIYYLY